MKENFRLNLRKYRRILFAVFFLFILLVLLLNIFAKDKEFSKVENRNLKQFPKFSYASMMDGSFTKDLESYFQDQFILRDTFISAKTKIEKVFLRKDSGNVYINHSDFLISKFEKNNDEETNEKINAVNKFTKAHQNLDISFMLVPNKVEIYKDKLPKFNFEESQKAYIDDFYSKIDGSIKKIDVYKSLYDSRNNNIFFKNDHHWTQNGAYVAYNVMKQFLKIKSPDIVYDIKKLSNDFYGTLSAKTGIEKSPDSIDVYVPKTETDYMINIPSEKKKVSSFYDTSKLKEKDQYLTFLGGNYPLVRIYTQSSIDKRILIIKDSYANSFVPFMVNDYNELILCDLRYYKGNIHQLIKDYAVTDVLFLYNVNTFNDDNSVLNLTDYLNKDGVPIESETTIEKNNTDKKDDASDKKKNN